MNFPETPSFSLKNKRALVTGAGRGIGLGASIALASAGADVMMVSRTAKELEEIYNHLKQLGHKSSYKSLDVTNQNDVSKLCLLYTSPSPRDAESSRMPSSA